jgi:peroxiredoxin Q/BCP
MGRTKRGGQKEDNGSSKKAKTEASPAVEQAEEPKLENPGKQGKSTPNDDPVKTAKAKLAIGEELPAFEVETDESTEEAKSTVSSAELVKESGIVIFFYPKANTGGCTTQACGFNEHVEDLEKAGYRVFGMSAGRFRQAATPFYYM